MTAFGSEVYVYLMTGVLALGATAVMIVPFLFLSTPSQARSPGKLARAAVKLGAEHSSVLRRIGDGIEWLLAQLWKLRLILRRSVDAVAAAVAEPSVSAEAEAERVPFWRRKRDSLRRIRALRFRTPNELAGAEEESAGLVLAPAPPPASPEPPPAVAEVLSATVSEPVEVAPDPPVIAEPPSAATDPAPPPSDPVPEAVVADPVAADALSVAEPVPPVVEEQLPPPAEVVPLPIQRLSAGDLAKWEENVDMMQEKTASEELERKEERFLAENVSDDVKEVFGTGTEDGGGDEDEEKSELDSMLDLFSTELVEETDANRLAALLGEVDARDLLSEAQEILNELRSPARGGG